MNSTVLSGNLTRDPDLYKNPKGDFCKFGLCVPNLIKKGAEPTFVEVTVFNPVLANICIKIGHKGARAEVQGSLEPLRTYLKNGEHCANIEISADKVFFTDKKAD